MSHPPQTPSPTAAPRPIWLPPRTGRTGRRPQFPDTYRIRRCKTRSLQPATGWRGSTDHSEWSSFGRPRPSEQMYRPRRPALVGAHKRRFCESLWDATRGPANEGLADAAVSAAVGMGDDECQRSVVEDVPADRASTPLVRKDHSRTSAGILSRCQSRSRTRADSASLAKAEAKAALIA
jgi:hypothetical protein